MNRITIAELKQQLSALGGQTVTVAGWVRSLRNAKSFGFLNLNDGSCFSGAQVVFEQSKLTNFFEIARLNVGAAVTVTATVLLTPQNPQPFELNAAAVTVEGASAPDYPLQKKRHSLEFLREQAYLRPRTNLFSAVFRIRSTAAFALHTFFNSRGFLYVHTPLITASDCEGAGEMFRVTTLNPQQPPLDEDGRVDYRKDFFGKQTNLTVSGQLEGETFAQAFGKIYTFGPTFRAENSNTARHAAEFWMIEPEIAFADLNDNMQLAWDMLQFVIRSVLEQCPEELEFLNRFTDTGLLQRLTKLTQSSYRCVTYTKAIQLLQNSKASFHYPVFWGCDLQTEHERWLTEQAFGGPVFVTDYPKEIKSFYMRLNNDGKTVAAMDLLVPGIGEIIGGSQREERAELLQQRMAECGLKQENYSWYLNLRRYGTTKHAGFGLGFERLIMYLTGVANIRDVIPYPRTVGNAEY